MSRERNGRTSLTTIMRRGNQTIDESFAVMRETIVLRLQASHRRAMTSAGEQVFAAGKEKSRQTAFSSTILTPRERSVLELVVQGKTTKRIAAELGIAFKTAASHRYSAMSKLGVGNTAALVRDSLRMGIGLGG